MAAGRGRWENNGLEGGVGSCRGRRKVDRKWTESGIEMERVGDEEIAMESTAHFRWGEFNPRLRMMYGVLM